MPTIERGILLAFNSGTYLATVLFAGSISTVVVNVPVSRAIAAAAMVTNSTVAVAVFDPANAIDAMVVGVC